MTAYLAIMANGESVDAVRIGSHFESLTGEILDPISLINFDQITRDQYAFEADFKKYTLKADFSKYDSLVYRNSLTDAAYKLWRIRGGLPMNDPEYKVISKDTYIPQSPIYRGRRGES
ncbi:MULTISPECIES: acetyl esterase [Acinetobacter]|uniref:acetyl esterase n=1 Tax=Acinetobacter TaxID=469 RepID=UPI000CFE4DE0|nr:acetyl esterase [Acinetobacter sp. MYb10]QLD61428.1 acetyl esterase [Acinetobacter sp. MYb10]